MKLGGNHKRVLLRCLFGVACASMGAALQWELWDWVGPSRFIIFYPSVIFASLFGGLCAGVVATVVGALGSVYLFFPPQFSLRIEDPRGWAAVGIFVAISIAFLLLNELLRRRQEEVKNLEVQMRTEQEFKQIFEASPYAVLAIVDESGTIIRINPQAEKIFGYRSEELIGKAVEVLVPERFRGTHPKLRGDYMKAPVARQLGIGRDLTGRRKDGTEVPIEIALTPMNMKGKTVILVTVTDISTRKQAEQVVRDSEYRYRSLFENMMDGFAHCEMIFDSNDHQIDFVYLDVNSAFEQLTGLKDVVGKKVSEVIPGIRESSPDLFETYGRVANTGNPERFETYVKPLDIWFSISVYSFRKGHFVAVFDNITGRKRAEESVRRHRTS